MIRVEPPIFRYAYYDGAPVYLVGPISDLERQCAWIASFDAPPEDRVEPFRWTDPETGDGFTTHASGRFADRAAFRDWMAELDDGGRAAVRDWIRETMRHAHPFVLATKDLGTGARSSPVYPVRRDGEVTSVFVDSLTEAELRDWGRPQREHEAECDRLWRAYQRVMDDLHVTLRRVHDAVAWRSFPQRAHARARLLGLEAFLAEVLPSMLAGTMDPAWHAANACAIDYFGGYFP